MIGGTRPAPRLAAKDLAKVAAVRVLVSLGVLASGFRGVSDDDYSRTVIAQTWALSPRLDPSGTSWLPFPFWLDGAAMLVFGRSLFVAQVVAVLLGVLSSGLVAIAAHQVTSERKTALFAGYFATLVGWSAWLGVAAVPECFTAALTLFAASSLATPSPTRRSWGALALFAATLSRYEPWPVAMVFAAWNLVDRGLHPVPGGPGRARAIAAAMPASLLAIAGPALWIGWNHVAHGDPFHFLARVTEYHRAIGAAAEQGVIERLAAYPLAFVREMPEVVLPAVVLTTIAMVPRVRAIVRPRLRRNLAPLGLAAVQILALSFALVKDGAPTHHPERAVLFPALALVLFIADVASGLPGKPRWPRAFQLACTLLFLRAVAAPVRRPGSFIDRRPEVEIGAIAAQVVPRGAKLFLQVDNYGYFAVLAASGRPEDFVLSRDLDPRRPDETPHLGPGQSFAEWLQKRQIGYLIAPAGESAGANTGEAWLAQPPLRSTGRFGLWVVPPS